MSPAEHNEAETNDESRQFKETKGYHEVEPKTKRRRIVVAGLGMVGMAFVEKLLKLDAKRQEYHVTIIGEETHLAYNRVGLTSFFEHRNVEELYLNPASWYASLPEASLSYQLDTRVISIDSRNKEVETTKRDRVPYDILVLATGSDALLPRHTPGHDANGVFVYRTISDLQKLIKFAAEHKGTVGCVVGGGLLGMLQLNLFIFTTVTILRSRGCKGDDGPRRLRQGQTAGTQPMASQSTT